MTDTFVKRTSMKNKYGATKKERWCRAGFKMGVHGISSI